MSEELKVKALHMGPAECAVDLGDGLIQGFAGSQQPLDGGQQVFGGSRHGNATFGAGKQWETAFRLHGRNRMTDGGGGQVQLLRGAGKAALVRNGGKNLAG